MTSILNVNINLSVCAYEQEMFHTPPFGTRRFMQEMHSFKSAKLLLLQL